MSEDQGYVRFGDLGDEYADLERSRAAILPVAYDLMSSWKRGAEKGPGALLAASHELELYDLPTGTEPYREGIATLAAIAGETDPERVMERVKARVGEQMEAGRLPVVIGGDHSVSIGAIGAAAEAESDVSVLQIDAHADLRDEYMGSRYNHACVMARAREVAPVVQVGIRSADQTEIGRLETERTFFAHQIAADPSLTWIPHVVDQLTDRVYLTIDLDAFDPSIMPATGTPEPGGMDWYQVNMLIYEVAARRRIVGFDVVELLPTAGFWSCEFLAAKLLYRTLAMVFATHGWGKAGG